MFSNHLSTQKKLFIMFLIVALLPLLILGMIAYDRSSKVVNGQLSNYNHFAGEKIKTQMDQTLGDMYYGASAIKQYISDSTSINLKHQEPSTYSDFKIINNLERLLEAHKKSNIRGIYVITSSGYYYGDYDLKLEKFKKQDLWKKAISSGDTEIGIYTPSHYKNNNPHKVIGLIVPLKFSYGVLNNSYLLIETDVGDLFNMMKLLENDMHSRITINSEEGDLLYRTKSSELDRKDDLVWNQHTRTNNWDIEIRIPRDEFYQSSRVIFKIITIGVWISFILALILSYLFSNQFTNRILDLKFAMDEVSKGIFDSKLVVQTKDEIGRLSSHFNRMVDKIKQLMEELKVKEATKREAEMKAVHYQINPHLLFNTLNTIQWKARIDGNEEIGKMLFHLSKVLEGNLNFTIELVSIKEELESIQHYLIIQEQRYGPHFTFSLKMEDRLREGLIPRMTLQPMLENIFFHAFEDGTGEIVLEVKETKEFFQLTLMDNGKGMEVEKLQSLFKRPEGSALRGGIGLYNVKQKYYVHYGKEFFIQADSEVDKGTTISISWPKRWMGEHDEKIAN